MDLDEGAPRAPGWCSCDRYDDAAGARTCLLARFRTEIETTAGPGASRVDWAAVCIVARTARNAAPGAHAPGSETLDERLASMDARLIEQERTIRTTLTMLIEWIEAGHAPAAPCLPCERANDDG